jgi:FkbM family methyltransferase
MKNKLKFSSTQERLLVDELGELFFLIQKETKPKISIEVGANSAEFSQKIIQDYPNISSWAFEANPYVHKHYENSLQNLGVKYLNTAITNKIGETRFLIQEAHLNNGEWDGKRINRLIGNNSLLIRNQDDVLYSAPKVDCNTLDGFFIDSGILNSSDTVCMWIDVEGAIEQVLSNSSKILKQVDSIFIEAEHFKFWQDQWLAEDVIKFLVSQDFFPIARDYEYEKQNNYIFIRSKLMDNNKILELVQNWQNLYEKIEY